MKQFPPLESSILLKNILTEMSSYLATGFSQNQQLLQLLRDCYMVVLPQTLLLLYFHHAKATYPTCALLG